MTHNRFNDRNIYLKLQFMYGYLDIQPILMDNFGELWRFTMLGKFNKKQKDDSNKFWNSTKKVVLMKTMLFIEK